MDYRQYPVPEQLRDHVACLWRLSDADPCAGTQTIYPDGFCELIVHLRSPPRCWDAAGGWHDQAVTLFAAQRVTAVKLAISEPLDCVGLRLQPAASDLIANKTLPALRDRIVDLAGLDRAFSKSLRTAARSFVAGSDAALWRLMTRRAVSHRLDARIGTAVERFQSSKGIARIDAAARTAGMSIRGFQTRFRSRVGLPPKEFARLMRLQATLRALDEGDASLCEVAANSGFADQAHATRDVRRITGLTPAKLRAALRDDRGGDVAMRMAASFVRGSSA